MKLVSANHINEVINDHQFLNQSFHQEYTSVVTFSLLVSRFANKSFHHKERVLILDLFGGDNQIFFGIMDQQYHQMDSLVEQM